LDAVYPKSRVTLPRCVPTQALQSTIDLLAGIFVLLRLIYTALYLADQATLRSIVWSLGLLTVISLFVLGI